MSSLLAQNLRPHAPPFRWLERWLRKTIPQLESVALGLDSFWTGSMAWSEDARNPGPISKMLGRHLAEALVRDDFTPLVLPVRPPAVPRWRGRYDFVLRKVGLPLMRAAERVGLY